MRFLFVDRIVDFVPGQWIRGLKQVSSDDYYLTEDASARPCFIPSLLGETLGQLAAWNVMFNNDFTARPVAGIVAKARSFRPVYVGETVLLESVIESLDEAAVQYRSLARVGSEPVFEIEGALGPLLPMGDFIDTETIKSQFNEVDRPGDWALLQELSVPVFEDTFDKASYRNHSFVFDHIIENEPSVSITASKCVSRAAPFFADHFPKKPVLPMTVLLECLLNLGQVFLKKANWQSTYTYDHLRKIKMNDFVFPGDKVIARMQVKQQDDAQLVLACRCEVGSRRVCVVELVMKAIGGEKS